MSDLRPCMIRDMTLRVEQGKGPLPSSPDTPLGALNRALPAPSSGGWFQPSLHLGASRLPGVLLSPPAALYNPHRRAVHFDPAV